MLLIFSVLACDCQIWPYVDKKPAFGYPRSLYSALTSQPLILYPRQNSYNCRTEPAPAIVFDYSQGLLRTKHKLSRPANYQFVKFGCLRLICLKCLLLALYYIELELECNENRYWGSCPFVLFSFMYRPFHKTLPKSSLQMHWISVRFCEIGDI